MRNTSRVLFYLIFGLGIVGLISLLISNPMSLLKTLLMIIVVASLIYVIYKLFINKSTSNDYSKYRRAVKQTKKRTKERTPSRPAHLHVIQSQPSQKKNAQAHKRTPNHLTVIDGKKRRKKKLFFQ